jgi:hypothetical protein
LRIGIQLGFGLIGGNVARLLDLHPL